MRFLSSRVALAVAAALSLAGPALAAGGGPWSRLEETWRQGRYELYLPFFTYHPPFAYSPAQRRRYNDVPIGAGLGKGRYDERGNWEGVVLMEFADSHARPEYAAAYSWLATWRPLHAALRLGAGFAAGLTARSDIRRYTPVPGVIPAVSLGLGPLDVQAAYAPGLKAGEENVGFCWLKLSFPSAEPLPRRGRHAAVTAARP